MPWDATPTQASPGKPWLRVNPDYARVNVESERAIQFIAKLPSAIAGAAGVTRLLCNTERIAPLTMQAMSLLTSVPLPINVC
jgi:hypothetical protein